MMMAPLPPVIEVTGEGWKPPDSTVDGTISHPTRLGGMDGFHWPASPNCALAHIM
jgi:hypothetical protein